MISAVSEATVPKISVIVRKCYGAGPLRDGGPGVRARLLPRAADRADRGDGARGRDQRGLLQPDPGDRGPERARARSSQAKRAEYAADIDILHLASELVVDAVIEPDALRARAGRGASRSTRARSADFTERRNPVTPV